MRRSRPLTAQAHGRQPRLRVGIQRPSELLRAIVVYVRATTKLVTRFHRKSVRGSVGASADCGHWRRAVMETAALSTELRGPRHQSVAPESRARDRPANPDV